MFVKSRQIGFTLIELMIMVAIIGILAAVAIPAHQDYIDNDNDNDNDNAGVMNGYYENAQKAAKAVFAKDVMHASAGITSDVPTSSVAWAMRLLQIADSPMVPGTASDAAIQSGKTGQGNSSGGTAGKI